MYLQWHSQCTESRTRHSSTTEILHAGNIVRAGGLLPTECCCQSQQQNVSAASEYNPRVFSVCFFHHWHNITLFRYWQNPIPTNKPGVEPKRPPRPVNITTNVKLSPTVANNISVQWCTDFNRGFVISAYLVKKLTSSQLLHRMKSKGIKPADYTRALSMCRCIRSYWVIRNSKCMSRQINILTFRCSQGEIERRCRLWDCHHDVACVADVSTGQNANDNAVPVIWWTSPLLIIQNPNNIVLFTCS